MKNYASMHLNGLELSVNLGWPKGERKKSQIVMLDVTIHFSKIPLGCTTDQLEDTYCYDALIKTIKNNVTGRDFRLLEHLGFELHRIVTENLPPDCKISIKLTKRPAILNLTGGVTFCYGFEKC
ncbi:MAG TPA: dihydroneopterin aldolase [Gammaproteobacteria bacterium]|nr:dihydroneopterin aldolase [Gammaproteobacteria bacterium]